MKFTEELKKKIGDENFKLIETEIKGKEIYLLDPKDYLPADKISELRIDQKKLKSENEKLNNDLTASKDFSRLGPPTVSKTTSNPLRSVYFSTYSLTVSLV